jgi:hypothetical protein
MVEDVDDMVMCGGKPCIEDKDKRMIVERLNKGLCKNDDCNMIEE